jgi:outer membrane receptor for ferrienterochelin and colicins
MYWQIKWSLLLFIFVSNFVLAQSDVASQDSTKNTKNKFISEVVITGTKTFKRKTESAVIVNILDSKTLNNLQVCNLSEGLKFQPGLRVETNCQTCNYTQLRMNGLQGGYSQILINGRPIFSPLMSLYGMEQLPVNMIEKIEVIRGGGSSLYGSSAIGGTVNVITKLPKKSGYEFGSFLQSIDGTSNDFNITGNATLVSDSHNAGVTFFFNKRNRDFFDANRDNFSELPKLDLTSLGLTSFLKLGQNQKIEFSLSHLEEYRLGGEMADKSAYLRQQSEERTHRIWMASADYQLNFNQDKTSLILYTALQNTKRDHYTGIYPDSADEIKSHLENPPYGLSNTTTWQGGLQLNHDLANLFKRRHVITLGSEYISDEVQDEIASYRYKVDQHTKNWGSFVQSDWDISDKLNILSGVRMDKHNLIENLVFNPRVALLYKSNSSTQFRLSYGTGFRAPQAFDTDLHIAFAGGGVSRVRLDPNLKEERSQSISASVNYDKVWNKVIAGFTLESFYTKLQNAFILENLGQDSFGELFEKRNGQSATVKGFTLELRANYNRKMQVETGVTLQNSEFENPVEYIQGVEPRRLFLRTPNSYGFANISFTPDKIWSFNLNYVYTGIMEIAHFGGAINFTQDQMVVTKSFSELNCKLSYTLCLSKFKHDIELFAGMKNILNEYQNDFDLGKNRDSNYIYGPNMPRSFFIGIKLRTD